MNAGRNKLHGKALAGLLVSLFLAVLLPQPSMGRMSYKVVSEPTTKMDTERYKYLPEIAAGETKLQRFYFFIVVRLEGGALL